MQYNTPPEIETEFKYLRPKKAEYLKKLHDDFENRTGKLRVREYENQVLTPLQSLGYSYTEERENQILDDYGFCTEVSDATADTIVKEETVIYAGYLRLHYGHFLVNTVARLWYIYAHPEVKYDKIVFACKKDEGTEIKGNILEFLNILGLTDKIEIIEGPTTYAHVIAPDQSISKTFLYYSDEYNLIFDRIREIVLSENREAPKQFPEKIFFTRTKFMTHGHVFCDIGCEFLDDYFKDNGFSIIAPEELSLRQLIHILDHAKVVASTTGTTTHNIIFGNRKSELILIERHSYLNEYQAAIDLSRYIKATYIDAHLTIKYTNYSFGLKLYYPTPQLMAFSKDNGFYLPKKKYFSDAWLKKKLKVYFNKYKNIQYQLYTIGFNITYFPLLVEAYDETFKIAGKYLSNQKAIFLSDIFFVWRKKFVEYASESKILFTILSTLRQLIYRIAKK